MAYFRTILEKSNTALAFVSIFIYEAVEDDCQKLLNIMPSSSKESTGDSSKQNGGRKITFLVALASENKEFIEPVVTECSATESKLVAQAFNKARRGTPFTIRVIKCLDDFPK